MKRLFAFLLLLVCGAALAASASISTPTSKGPLIYIAYDTLAGAIGNVTWDGNAFIDSADHGRLLQSAASFDNLGEAFNPTQGGARNDGWLLMPSTSVLLSYTVGTNWLTARNQMAFWDPVAGAKLSNHIHTQTVTLGYNGVEGAAKHEIAFQIPPGETHSLATFEVLTGYMPDGFSVFEYISTVDGLLHPLSDGPGEQSYPIVFSTPDGSHAMGVWSDNPLAGGGYGRWRHPGGSTTQKWNVVARQSNPVGSYTFRVYTVIGTRASVLAGLTSIYYNHP